MMTDTTDQTQLPAGTNVESADGQKLGSIKEIQLNHYLVEKGLFFKHDLYVPKGTISTFDGNTAWLSVTKDQIDASGWDQPPMADAPPGMAAEVLPDTPVEVTPPATDVAPGSARAKLDEDVLRGKAAEDARDPEESDRPI